MSLRVWLRAMAGNWRHRKRLVELREAVAARLSVLPVASAQLRDTNRQVEQAVAQVGTSFERMVESARESANQASRLVGDGGEAADGPAAGVSGLLSASRTTLEGLLIRIVRDSEVCRKLVERMDELERDTGQIVRALEQVDRISFGNAILALNAKIEAAHIGERGQGFELVAQELWMQSQRSGQITGEIRTTILRLAGGAKAAVGEIGGMACADRAHIAALQAQVHEALDRLKHAHQGTQQALADGETRNQALAAEIAAAVQAMQFQDRVSQQITHVVEALEAMQAAIAAPLGSTDDPHAGAPAAVDLLSRSYTMEGERSVHAAILGEERAGQQVLDDVEIF
jgi:methyl-accepting chemotaxis protein